MTCRLEQEGDSRTRVYESQSQCGGNYLEGRLCVDLDVDVVLILAALCD